MMLSISVRAAGPNPAVRIHGHAGSQNRSCPLEVVPEGTESLVQRTPNVTARGWGRSMPHG